MVNKRYYYSGDWLPEPEKEVLQTQLDIKFRELYDYINDVLQEQERICRFTLDNNESIRNIKEELERSDQTYVVAKINKLETKVKKMFDQNADLNKRLKSAQKEIKELETTVQWLL